MNLAQRARELLTELERVGYVTERVSVAAAQLADAVAKDASANMRGEFERAFSRFCRGAGGIEAYRDDYGYTGRLGDAWKGWQACWQVLREAKEA